MSIRLKNLFKEKKNILSVYYTAGFPALNDTTLILSELEKSGADMVEIGIPFSDPLADGPVIQKSSEIALKNGMSLNLLFDQLKDIRKNISIPILLMGYLNPIVRMGMEKFCEKCMESGMDGLIIPDLPLDEYSEKYKTVFQKFSLANVLLITPQTSEERIKKIDEETAGFIYVVSSSATTGRNLNTNFAKEYFERVSNLNLKNPLLIGFGISDRESFNFACKYANGAIIGSSFIKRMEKSKDLKKSISEFISEIRFL